jgi:hypothetical protein
VVGAGGALDDRSCHPARHERHPQQGEAAAAGEALVVAVASAARAEELAVPYGRPRGAGAQEARRPGGSAVSSPYWQHVAPP